MNHNFNSDPSALAGYWSPQTSAANFCEIDYEVTHYIAEFINTLSNLAYIWQGVITLPAHLRGRGRELQLWRWPVENLALLLVGVGSMAFHLSLLHEMQIVDESGMYLLVGALDYRLWGHGMGTISQQLFGLLLGSAIFGVIGWNFIGTHDGKADNGIHLALFIALLTALWPRVLYTIKQQSKERKQAKGSEGKDEIARKLMWEYRLGIIYFFSGFGLWLIDGRFCYDLRNVRAIIRIPLAWVLEFHGWWHFLTALGAGRFVWVVRELTTSHAKKN
ncbi:hypothetical protein H072_7171 [Dactylellina haptotyla CBS 200.50]|uniref:Alkaline phytoceramidase n=1 Tax=Dactylellina haptotyla (strain CBS 200.50) TaxID=1284197 RepID=S8A877_DACHA|nr:hypothetical protein H072_7171 [Dactylellina haptotyla CBS 200.50]